jgi:hypothetical protein
MGTKYYALSLKLCTKSALCILTTAVFDQQVTTEGEMKGLGIKTPF